MKQLKLSATVFLMCVFAVLSAKGDNKRVLFLGNSYTYVNDLPGVLRNCVLSAGDTLIYDSHMPGGIGVGNHLYSSISIGKIMEGSWDHVILQGQSIEFIGSNTYLPGYADSIDGIIKQYSPCGKTMFYMTWGYKNGDPSSCTGVPVLCTYETMDSAIRSTYIKIADSNKAELSPVGAVRHYIRHHYPTIDLYEADEQHPSLAGAYAAACCFYAALYRKDPSLISFNPGLPAGDAANIRNAAKIVTFDSLMYWNVGKYDTIINPGCIPTGVNEPPYLWSWRIYPNPATATITISCGDNEQRTLMIYNSIGQLCTTEIIAGTASVAIGDLAPGNYFIRIQGTEGVAGRFVKE